MAHIAIIGALPESLTNFRGHLIRSMTKAGHSVTAMAAHANEEQVQAIESLGAIFLPYPVQRNGLNPWRDLQTFLALRRIFREIKPDVVLAYTIKPIIWGGIALNNIPRIRFYALITGLGFAFQGKGLIRRNLTRLVAWLYRFTLRRANRVIFQNMDNRDEFVSLGLVDASKCNVVEGSGVDVFRFSEVGFLASAPTFLLIARLLGDKGIREYVQAASQVLLIYPSTRFKLLGPLDTSPDGIALSDITNWHAKGIIEYLGASSDVRPSISDCHVYVLPSYHEGMPRTVLEAMAMGRPILTTNVPGCRETVIQGENGYLVPKADAEALAERMIWFVEHSNQWRRMGQISRRIAEERFDVHIINDNMLIIMNLKEKGILD